MFAHCYFIGSSEIGINTITNWTKGQEGAILQDINPWGSVIGNARDLSEYSSAPKSKRPKSGKCRNRDKREFQYQTENIVLNPNEMF